MKSNNASVVGQDPVECIRGSHLPQTTDLHGEEEGLPPAMVSLSHRRHECVIGGHKVVIILIV